MNVTRNVVADLLPAYAAGEAHADTRALVEAWLAGDPALARELDALRGVDTALSSHAASALPTGEGLIALRRTRLALRLRSTLLGLAIFFSLVPFSVHGGEDGVVWLAQVNPGLAVTSGAVAVAMWLGWFLFAARMRVRSGV
jgi:anti-sigma factor RsiW